ncbi:hypothetical protein M3P05_11840 [Sansalvadorimonas sp. 2012CJ34-2]|uniref:Uncharacterized protein n=1 Tax=Parendozoicomonas callyspongiae TaxID=2942213 RepID=A0ABT0PH86_9GAMM|nr:hypothetical protein [Sansalvadorimonas sp. 2012CJ34-2]MCL6270616.1 hypothetical protein [Sansalvadorimonas sp. 2012CJ34-2]
MATSDASARIAVVIDGSSGNFVWDKPVTISKNQSVFIRGTMKENLPVKDKALTYTELTVAPELLFHKSAIICRDNAHLSAQGLSIDLTEADSRAEYQVPFIDTTPAIIPELSDSQIKVHQQDISRLLSGGTVKVSHVDFLYLDPDPNPEYMPAFETTGGGNYRRPVITFSNMGTGPVQTAVAAGLPIVVAASGTSEASAGTLSVVWGYVTGPFHSLANMAYAHPYYAALAIAPPVACGLHRFYKKGTLGWLWGKVPSISKKRYRND